MTSQELLQKRFSALENGDFVSLYATYHCDSPFIRQFPDQQSYLQFARQHLNTVKVVSWQSLRQRRLGDQRQEHLLVMQLDVAGGSQYLYELALLLNTADGWRYHSAQKLTGEDYSGPPGQIEFAHFDQIKEKLRY